MAKKNIITAPLQHGNQDGNMKNCESIVHTNLLVKVHATFISYLNVIFKIKIKYEMTNCQFANCKCSKAVRKKRSKNSKKYLPGKPLES